MGLYLRKALSVGPFRFNLSKSGVGVSVGIPGFRLGASPRGNYVHMGRGGIYYRSSLGARADRGSGSPASSASSPSALAAARPPAAAKFAEIDSGSVLEMKDASSTELLQQITTAARYSPAWPWWLAVAGAAAVVIRTMTTWPIWTAGAVAAVLLGATIYVGILDKAKSRVVLFYDFEPELEAAYEKVSSTFEKLGGAHRIWHKTAVRQVDDTRYSGGAGREVKNDPIRLRWDPPPMVETNIRVPAISVGAQVLHFFPDRLLVLQGKNAGAVNYAELAIRIEVQRYLEEQGVPSDAKVVGSTWKYVNKSGGPDRRFKDNREIPICEYEELYFTSKSGLNECVGFSALGRGEPFTQAAAALGALNSATPRNQSGNA